MRILLFCLCFIFIGATAQTINKLTAVERARTISFDDSWKFIRDSIKGAENINFDDHKWKLIDLPHDWSIEDLPNQTKDSIVGPFTKASIGTTATGFVSGGTGWYRKSFISLPDDENKIISISFDGVYMNADVWLNGHHLGNHPYGYTPFNFELNKWIKPAGGRNVLAVRVRNVGKNSRWYSGSGIYRHVWLTRTERVRIPVWGIYITTPQISEGNARVQLVTTLESREKLPVRLTVETFILTANGTKAGRLQSSILLKKAGQSSVIQNISVAQPQLWSVENPYLYKAITYIKSGNKAIDSTETVFGIRYIQLDAANGLRLNGKKIWLKGGCMHHDNGPLGSVTFDRAEERKIQILKKNGYNAIRTSHNPPSKQLLDACDHLGMLVIDEAFDMWERPKNPDDYHLFFDSWWDRDLTSMILRDRNHPSVLFWSVGNEINERADSSGLQIESRLVKKVHELDPTRLVTEAICFFWDHPGRKWNTTAPAFAMLDAGGYNYQWREYEADHQLFPNRIMMGTESVPMEAYENWRMVEKHPYVIGDFVWTAVDYIGETAIGHTLLSNQQDSFSLGWPWYDAYCGDIDLIGSKKPQSYYRDIIWGQSKIEMAVHVPLPDSLKEKVSYWGWPDEIQSWTWPGLENKKMQVRVFSRASKIRLLLNGKLIEEREIPDSSITAVFEVPYNAGELKAIAIDKEKETGYVSFKTTGAARHIRLTADRTAITTNRNDLSYITVEVTDEDGNIIPDASSLIQFSISGSGTLAATGSGDPKDMASFHRPERKTFRGRCMIIIRPDGKPGTIKVKAFSDGLTSSELKIISNN